MTQPKYSVFAKDPEGYWHELGTSYAAGIVPEGISHAAELPGGASTLSFTLQRDSRVPWPDLQPFTPIVCKLGSVNVWSGRIMGTPTTRGDSSSIRVSAQGAYSHLSDKPFDKAWVVRDLSRWRDTTQYPINPASYYSLGARIEAQDDGIMIVMPRASVAIQNTVLGSVTLDLGPYNTCKRVVCTHRSFGSWGASVTLYCRTSAFPNTFGGITTGYTDAFTLSTPTTGPVTTAGTAATGYRYVTLALYYTGATTALAADQWIQFQDVMVFTDTADESGNASILKASTVVSEAIAAGCDSDVINTSSTSNITTTTFNIPEFYTRGKQTVAECIDSVNAYHGYQFYLTNDPIPEPVFRAVPTTPEYLLQAADAYTFEDAGRNDASDVFNEVTLEYESGDGMTRAVTIPAEPYPKAVFANSPLAYWRLNDTTAQVLEHVGAQETWTVASPTTGVASPLTQAGGAAMTFNGSSQYAVVNSMPHLHPGDTFTFECFYKRSSTGGSGHWIYDNGASDFCVAFSSTDKIVLNKANISVVWTSTSSYTDTSSWHHLMIVKNAGSSVTVYLDGSSIAGSFVNATMVAGTADPRIGNSGSYVGTNYFAGSLAEIAIYNTALTAADVAAHYAAKTASENTVLARRGYKRTKTIEARTRLTPAAAQQIALAYLNATTSAPLKGNVTVKGTIGRYSDGARIPVGAIKVGEIVMLGNETNPTTGAKGRAGQIAAVSYDHDSQTASLQLDSRKDYIDQLLERIGAYVRL